MAETKLWASFYKIRVEITMAFMVNQINFGVFFKKNQINIFLKLKCKTCETWQQTLLEGRTFFFSNKVASMANIYLSKNSEFNKTDLEIV